MIFSTRGVVLHQINYGESSVVTKVYTEVFGLRSYIINGVRARRAKIKTNILQPLSVLDMGVYNRDNRNLQRVKYANAINPASEIGLDIVKGSLAMFIAEVLYRSIKEEEPNQQLFDYLMRFIKDLEGENGSVANHNLIFMIELSGFLGFAPSIPSGDLRYFDKREGVFCDDVPQHGDWMDTSSSNCLKRILEASSGDASQLSLTTSERNDLVSHLIAYYNLHLDSRFEIKSHKVLQTVMN